MRKVNYWKTLLVVLCTGCIFAACGTTMKTRLPE